MDQVFFALLNGYCGSVVEKIK